jgi:hypothetical protein
VQRELLDEKVKALRLKMMAMMAAKQGLPGEVDGDSEGSGDRRE